MKYLILTQYLMFSILYSWSQKTDSIEVIKGSEKYKKEIIEICKSYSKILDSLQKDRFDKMAKDSLWSQNEMKNIQQKYNGYEGSYEGYLMSEEEDKILRVLNKFLKINRISSWYVQGSKGVPSTYSFYYYRTITDPNGSTRIINGKVIWVDD
jgi:hypothetical protein